MPASRPVFCPPPSAFRTPDRVPFLRDLPDHVNTAARLRPQQIVQFRLCQGGVKVKNYMRTIMRY